MDVVILMHPLQAFQQLIEDHQCSLQTEALLAELEQVFERWAQQRRHHVDEVVLHRNALVNERDKVRSLERLDALNLLQQVRERLPEWLSLDCDFQSLILIL